MVQKPRKAAHMVRSAAVLLSVSPPPSPPSSFKQSSREVIYGATSPPDYDELITGRAFIGLIFVSDAKYTEVPPRFIKAIYLHTHIYALSLSHTHALYKNIKKKKFNKYTKCPTEENV